MCGKVFAANALPLCISDTWLSVSMPDFAAVPLAQVIQTLNKLIDYKKI
jgi:hypothetical protein